MSTTLFFVRVNNPLKFNRSDIENTHSDELFDKFGQLWRIDQANDSAYEDENLHVYDLSDPMENDRYMQDFNDQILDEFWCYANTDDDAVERFNAACDRHKPKKKFVVKIPLSTFVEFEIDAEDAEEARDMAEMLEYNTDQLLDNMVPNGDSEAREITKE